MEWTVKIKEKSGTTRIRKHFLFRPKTINTKCRWLCFAKYKQILIFGGSLWVDLRYID